MLLKYLKQIKDNRRAQGRRYELCYILLFAILAILSGADSYRAISSFIEIRFDDLKATFGLKWKKRPAYTTIRGIIQGANKEELEKAFRSYSEELHKIDDTVLSKCIAIDGKTLRGSFDNFIDKKALHILNIFATCPCLVLANGETDEKSNEIPAVQKLLIDVGLSGYIMTLDALHCQKNS
jgi:hypothetical protein